MVTHRYSVIGFDKDGKGTFAIEVEALDHDDARLIAGATMRKTPQGSVLWTTATRLETKRER